MGWLTVTVCCVTLLSLSTAVLSMRLDKEELREIDELLRQLLETHKRPHEKASIGKHHYTHIKGQNGNQRENYKDDDSDSALEPIRQTTVGGVFGVAYLNGQLFAISNDDARIRSINMADMSVTKSVSISGLNNPSDIAACNRTNKLFVLGRSPDDAWWRIDPSNLNVEAKYSITGQSAESLSVRNGVVSMATKNTGKLIQYDGSTGQQITAVTVTTQDQRLTPRHVVELPDGTYVSSIKSSRGMDTNDQISILDPSSGRVIGQSFGGSRGGGSEHANLPYHLAVCTGSRRVLAADFGNRRILRINLRQSGGLSESATEVVQYSNSKAIQDGSDSNPRGRPWRVWVDEVERIFIVAISAGQVYVYDLSDVGC